MDPSTQQPKPIYQMCITIVVFVIIILIVIIVTASLTYIQGVSLKNYLSNYIQLQKYIILKNLEPQYPLLERFGLNATEIKSGKLQVTDISRCLSGQEPTCYYQNPLTPYTILNFSYPQIPNLEGLSLNAQLQLGSFYLAPSDIMILYGYTHPPCKYWSYNINIINDPSVCGGTALAAAISDTVNNVNSGLAFNEPYCIIVGSNWGVIYEAARSVNSVYRPIVLPIPFISLTSKLLLLGRTALFDSPEDGTAYYSNTHTLGSVVRYNGEINESLTITEPIYIPRNPIYSEITDYPTQALFDTQAEQFIQSVLKSLPSNYQYVLPIKTFPFYQHYNYDNGFDCIKNCINCNFDNRDTVYTVVDNHYLIQPNQQVVVMYGVNHSVYYKSIYTNVSVYDEKTDTGLVSFDYTLLDPSTYSVIVIPDPPGTSIDHSLESNYYVLPSNINEVVLAERAYVQTRDAAGTPNDMSGISSTPETLILPKAWVISTVAVPETYKPTDLS